MGKIHTAVARWAARTMFLLVIQSGNHCAFHRRSWLVLGIVLGKGDDFSVQVTQALGQFVGPAYLGQPPQDLQDAFLSSAWIR